MAEIPVERKTGGFPWWLIPLLLLLLLIPLLFFMTRGCNDGAVVGNANNNGNANRAMGAMNSNASMSGNSNAAVVVNSNATGAMNSNATGAMNSNAAGSATGGAAITDLNGLTGDASLAGRAVNLNAVKVTRVLSDRVFTVGSGAGETFVLLDENLDSGGGKEKQIKIRAGQTLNLGGDVRSVPNAETKDEQSRDLNRREYAQMKDKKVYLHARSVSDAK